MRIFPKYEKMPEMHPKDANRIANVNAIANSIEKANRVLEALLSGDTGNYNEEAIATWTRIIASLQMRWRDAMVEVETKGHYSFE